MATMGLQEDQIFGKDMGSSQEGPGHSSSSEVSKGEWPCGVVGRIDDNRIRGRRTKAYENIMTEWKKAASAVVPTPRSSHRRILGGQALPTRQRAESFSLEKSRSSSRRPSWGNLSDTVSATVQSAWREQLLRLKLSRLSRVPMTVILRQRVNGSAESCRVVATSQSLSAKLAALAVVEGTCMDVALSTASQVEASTPATTAIDGISSSSGTRGGTISPPSKPPLSAKTPVRGFHLVDLHAVVRNSVEWSHCLPKVEPCFRVSSNRDAVLLGLVHALGGRLTCSSEHDIRAGVSAARRVGPAPAPPPRLLDRHVCRSPVLLRASVAAGAQLYEVDSADELLRIHAARRKLGLPANVQPRGDAIPGPRETTPAYFSRAAELAPASVMIRLALPSQPRRRYPESASATSTDADFSGALEATYGARSEDVIELAQSAAAVAAAASVGAEHVPGMQHSVFFASCRSSTLPIVGFSIDVGSACWNDALASSAVTSPGRRGPDASTPASSGAAQGEAVASAPLTESIDAAVAFAVKMACVAAEATAAARAIATTSISAAVVGEAAPSRGGGSADIASGSKTLRSAATTTPSPSSFLPPSFSFRRLHVTGLGEGGARREPLAALKAALSRHLPEAVLTSTSGGHNASGRGNALPSAASVGRPIVVSADATEHLVAGGVWSTVASIIGRKSVPPSVGDHDSPISRPLSKEETRCPASEQTVADDCKACGGGSGSGAMYYIDDGCYGSLSGALLRGAQLQPLPLRVRAPLPRQGSDSGVAPTAVAVAGETRHHFQDEGSVRPGAATPSGGVSNPISAPCTVWGPTCDGLDCVCRMTHLPNDMESGRDWLFFPDVGIRGGADATEFNGLKPLETFYLVRQREDT